MFFPCPECKSPVEWVLQLTNDLLNRTVKIMPCGHVMTEQEIVNGMLVHRPEE